MLLRRRTATLVLPAGPFSMVLRSNVPMAFKISEVSAFFYGYIIGFLGRGIGPSQDLLSQQDGNKQEITDIRPRLLRDLKNRCPSGRGSTGLTNPPPKKKPPHPKTKLLQKCINVLQRTDIYETEDRRDALISRLRFHSNS